MRILIADDSSVVRERLVALLSELKDIEVVGQAEDAPAALDSIQALRPDVVILDIQMPGGNGIDVLQNIKQVQRPPVVIMLTNYPYPAYRKKCVEAGADFFLDKTMDFERVIEVLKGTM